MMEETEYFTRTTLPPDTIIMVVKANDGKELACVIRRDHIHLMVPTCQALLETLDEYEGKGRLQ